MCSRNVKMWLLLLLVVIPLITGLPHTHSHNSNNNNNDNNNNNNNDDDESNTYNNSTSSTSNRNSQQLQHASHNHHNGAVSSSNSGSSNSNNNNGGSSSSSTNNNHNLSKRSNFFDLECKGIFNKTMFFRLDRICEDCYSLFRETIIHRLCKKDCFDSKWFGECLKVLRIPPEEVAKLQESFKMVNGSPINFNIPMPT